MGHFKVNKTAEPLSESILIEKKEYGYSDLNFQSEANDWWRKARELLHKAALNTRGKIGNIGKTGKSEEYYDEFWKNFTPPGNCLKAAKMFIDQQSSLYKTRRNPMPSHQLPRRNIRKKTSSKIEQARLLPDWLHDSKVLGKEEWKTRLGLNRGDKHWNTFAEYTRYTMTYKGHEFILDVHMPQPQLTAKQNYLEINASFYTTKANPNPLITGSSPLIPEMNEDIIFNSKGRFSSVEEWRAIWKPLPGHSIFFSNMNSHQPRRGLIFDDPPKQNKEYDRELRD